MDKATDEILAKIKKLMALGASPSEAEAASALEKARVLLARYGLSLADVETHSPDVVEGILLEKKRLRPWESQLIFVISNCTFTQALHVRRGDVGQVLLIGRELNTLAAADLFKYLHLVVLKLGRAHSGKVAHLESFRRGVVERIGERLTDASAGREEAGGIWAAPETEPDGGQRATGRNGQAGEPDGDLLDAGLLPAGPAPAAESGTNASDRQLTIQMSRTAKRENADFIEGKYGKTKTKRVGRRVDAASYYRGRTAGDGVSLNRQIK